MVKFILIKSPDEWATTKQAFRDELIVYLFFSPIYLTIIRRKQGEYCRIIPETKSRGLFDNIHRA